MHVGVEQQPYLRCGRTAKVSRMEGWAERRPTSYLGPMSEPTPTPPSSEMDDDALEQLRSRLVEIDQELVALVGERLESVLRIGQYKAERGLPVLDPGQEAKVIRRAAQMARDAGVNEEMVRDIIWRIMAAARDAQEGRTRWGPPGPAESETDL